MKLRDGVKKRKMKRKRKMLDSLVDMSCVSRGRVT